MHFAHNRMLFLIVIIIIIIVISSCSVIPCHVRSLELTIVDKKTQNPLSNILVFSHFRLARAKNILGIPMIDPINYRNIALEKYFTIDSGKVTIPEKTIYLYPYESLYLQEIFINLDIQPKMLSTPFKNDAEHIELFLKYFIKENISESKEEFIVNPKIEYKGAVFTIAHRSKAEVGVLKTVTTRKYNKIITTEKLDGKKGSFVIELENWNDPLINN